MRRYRRGGGGGTILFVSYLVFGIYLLNKPFNFLGIPPETKFLTSWDPWITFIGGILILLGAFNYLRLRRYMY